jgi:cytochrome b561
MTPTHHDPITRSIHWIIALAVAAAYAVAVVREELPKGDFRTFLLGLHMWIGMAVLGLSVVRLAWRTAAPAIDPTPGTPAIRLAAKAAHIALYIALLLLPVVGLLAAWGKGRSVTLFGLMPLLPPIAIDRETGGRLEDLHGLVGHAVMILAGLHAAAAIGHQWLLKDGTLGRMLPFLGGANRSAAE